MESGAADGEEFSNSLYLERFMNWTGILIEPEPTSYQSLLKTNRKSWTVPSCLSLEKYPTEVHNYSPPYTLFPSRFWNFVPQVAFDKEEIIGKIRGKKLPQSELGTGKIVNVQCFPLYSILLANKRRKIDFFSLDVEGHELHVLKTIPWNKVDIRVK